MTRILVVSNRNFLYTEEGHARAVADEQKVRRRARVDVIEANDDDARTLDAVKNGTYPTE